MDPLSPGGGFQAIDFSNVSDEPKKPTLRQIESAAQQFEGLLLHQMLKSASSEGGGWLGTGEEDSAGLQAMELAQEQFASALAARGGLGLARIVIPQLTAEAAAAHSKQP
ncbi:MAG: hypothetical protein ABI811_18975 [Acidobacteriota bacterium]